MAHFIHNYEKPTNMQDLHYESLVYSLGGYRALHTKLVRFYPNLEHNLEKVKKIVMFFSQFPELSESELQPLIGYINHMFHEQVNYKLSGRTMNSLRRASDAYYEEMQRRREERDRIYDGPQPTEWKGAPYNGWKDDEGHVIVQLTKSLELSKESEVMNHCVRTYAYKCKSNECSIWSLRFVDEEEGATPLVTIEVHTPTRKIIQAKAEYNQAPSENYLEMIRIWAKQEKLTIGEYL